MGLKSLWQRLFGKKQVENVGRLDTEGACEVVRISRLSAHGNAEKLEVANFDMGTGPTGYEVVIQKGSFKVGDLAVYLSVDCIVPISGPFAFLGERQDGRGKTQFRLRAARLRGRYSQGLLVPNDLGLPLGTQCWEQLGVTYYSPPAPGESTPPSTKKPRPQAIPVYGVDSLMKAPNLFADQEQVFITEKIHGTNFRFGWIRRRFLGIPCGWRFVVGSHRVIKTDEFAERAAGWCGEDLYTDFATKNDLAARTSGHKGHVFYGELYGYTYSGKPIQDLVYDNDGSPFGISFSHSGPRLAIFDVLVGGQWLHPRERLALCDKLRLPHVPVLPLGGNGPFSVTDFEAMSDGKSVIAPGQIREGIVVETIGVVPRRKAKYVSQQYHLRDGGKHNPKKYSLSPRQPTEVIVPHAPGCLAGAPGNRTSRGCACGADHQ